MISELRWWHSQVMLHSIPHCIVSPWRMAVYKTTWIIHVNRMVKAVWTCDISMWGSTGDINADVNANITAYNFHFSYLLPTHPSPLELFCSWLKELQRAFFLCVSLGQQSWSLWNILFLMSGSDGWDTHSFILSVCSIPYFHWGKKGEKISLLFPLSSIFSPLARAKVGVSQKLECVDNSQVFGSSTE